MKYPSTVKRWHIAIAAIFLLSSFNYCTFFIHGAQTKWENNFDEFQYLQQCMSGSFSSELQSKQDSDFFDIRLRMVPIWTPSSTEFFLYVEQARADMLDKPYRQRIYKVVKEDNTHFTSYIYMAPNQELLVGKESNDSVFSTFTADSLKIKDGCEVHLTFNVANQSYSGATNEGTCPSDRQGAKYATSKVELNNSQLYSWDQGWDENHKQVWGATKSGYLFRRVN
jgi:hypothetical protein